MHSMFIFLSIEVVEVLLYVHASSIENIETAF